MLNVSAKEFVPAITPKPAVAAATTGPAKDGSAGIGDSGGSDKLAVSGCHSCAGRASIKAQLSPKAPEFVPRGGVAGTTAKTCLLDTASNPPRSVITPPRSDSTLSSSIESREADGCWGYGKGHGEKGQWYEEDEQPALCGGVAYDGNEGSGYCGSYYQGAQQQGGQGYEACDGGYDAATTAVQGGELAPRNAVAGCGPCEQYNYNVYDGYAMPFSDVGADTLGAAVYYDVQYAYDTTRQYEAYPQRAYYWEESAGAYVYPDAQYGADEYGGWPSQEDGWDAAGPVPTAGEWVSFADPAAAATPEVDVADGADIGLGLSDEQLLSLAASDAAELLEMFFPAYAGGALSRLLERTNGDLLATFAELSAMERQVGAERAAAAASGGRVQQQHRHGGGGGASGRAGGRGPGTGGGAGGGRRSGGGGGNGATFKLDMESFPSLSLSPSPHPPAKKSSQPPSTEDHAAAAASADSTSAPAKDNGDQPPPHQQATSTTPSTLPRSTSAAVAVAAGDATASGPSASPWPSSSSPVPAAKPNFAAMLSSSPSAPAPGVSSAAAGGKAGPCSSSGFRAGYGGYGSGAGTAAVKASSSAAAAAAVPWVSTGEAVSSQYAEERREASLLARARNQCFQQATLAYLSGNKALAKQLGRRGRELNEAMKAAHAAAARRIFAQRNDGLTVAVSTSGASTQHHSNNPKSYNHHRHQRRQYPRQQQHGAARDSSASVPAVAVGAQEGRTHQQQQRRRQQQQAGSEAGGEALFVDLHGLHATEAVAVLEAQIEEARAAGCRFLRVCTGAGNHTKTPARLPVAVADALLANHLTFKTLKPGLLEAQL